MKKRIILSLILVISLFMVAGCGKKDKNNNQESSVWKADLNSTESIISDTAKKVFNDAKGDKNLTLVALLGKQVVAGTNYMFLCKDGDSYKSVVVYNDLEGKSEITHINDFDLIGYVNTDISYNDKDVVGGWNVDIPSKGVMLEEKIQTAFDNAVKNTKTATYLPIAILGVQNESNTNYGILTYGKFDDEDKNGIYLITLHVDQDNTSKVLSTAFVDLALYNE